MADTDGDNRLSKAEVHALLRAQVSISLSLSLSSLSLSVSLCLSLSVHTEVLGVVVKVGGRWLEEVGGARRHLRGISD
jgi:hypothetical protein